MTTPEKLIRLLAAKEAADRDCDVLQSRTQPFRPAIYRLRRPLSSPTRGMSLDEALRCSRILGLCVIDVETQGEIK